VDPLDLTAAPHPKFPVQGHILSASGDALSTAEEETETVAHCRGWARGDSEKRKVTQK
jgi:hypothetical protein